MKFLLIASFPHSIYKFRGDLIKDLQKKGFEVHVAAPLLNIDEDDFDIVNLKKLNVQLHSYSLNRRGKEIFKDVSTLIELSRLISSISPQYVLAYTIKPVIYGMIASYFCRVPNRFAMITGLGIAFTDDNKKSFSKIVNALIKLLYKISLKCSSKIIFQNKDDRSLFKSLKIILKNSNTAIINGSGVNLKDYKETPLPKNLNFLFIGRFLSSKGLREFVEAAKIIKLTNPQIEFSVAGWTEDSEDSISKEELFEWVEEKIINDLGYLDDVRPAIANASVFVLPSYREGTPRSVLEAMAMGRPVITSDAPGCRETVTNKFNGFLVPVGSTKEIVKAINFYINNPDSVKEMGSHSLELVKEKYDVKIINNIMLSHMGINNKLNITEKL